MADIGETLRAARESRGLSIEQAAQDTRISARFIEAIEAEDFDALPAPVYVRGFLRSYSNYLRVDPQPLLDELGASGFGAAAAAAQTVPPRPATPPNDPFATTPRARAGYEEIPMAPERTLADDGDQWWPENSEEDRGLWPDAAPRERAVLQDAVPETAITGAAVAASAQGASSAPAEFAPRAEPEHERLRRLRETGILVEPEPAMRRGGEGGRNTRMIAIVGAAVFGLVAIVVAAMSLLGGGGDDATPAGADEPTREGSVIPVGTATPQRTATPRISVTPRPSTTPNPRTPTATVGPSQTPAPTTAGQPTNTPGGGGGGQPTTAPQPSATSTNVPANTAVPSNTPPPTQTPQPTATQIPIPPHGSGLSECPRSDSGAVNCGPAPYAVVCEPTGGWFLDYGGDFSNPRGWPVYYVQSPLDASGVC